jgi:hypothetical protein
MVSPGAAVDVLSPTAVGTYSSLPSSIVVDDVGPVVDVGAVVVGPNGSPVQATAVNATNTTATVCTLCFMVLDNPNTAFAPLCSGAPAGTGEATLWDET